MTTIQLSHFKVNDHRHPVGRERLLYQVITTLRTQVGRCRSIIKHLSKGSNKLKVLEVLHHRLSHRWRSLTSGVKKQAH